jgi:hypothetical protein
MSEKYESGTESLLVKTQRPGDGLTQNEVDELSLKIERLLLRGEDPEEIIEWVLTELPDSEYGHGEWSVDTGTERDTNRTEDKSTYEQEDR